MRLHALLATLVISAFAAEAFAANASIEILEVKQMAQPQDKNAYFHGRIETINGAERTDCTLESGMSIFQVDSSRSMFPSLMQLATAGLLSGRRLHVWFTVDAATKVCNVNAVTLK